MSHSLQYMLVVADSHQGAQDAVASKLTNNPDWSDWSYGSGAEGSFAGSWAFTAFSEEKGDSEPKGVINDCLSYAENPELAEKIIADCAKHRLNAIKRYKDGILTTPYDITEADYDPFEAEKRGLENYYYLKLAQILDNQWTSESHAYDLHYWTASFSNWQSRVSRSPEKQFIVAVDFHH